MSDGILGQLGDVLSAPRRGVWSALGLPEHGNELVSRYTGMDPNSMLTHALGFGAELAGDPLTYAGLLGGGPLAKFATFLRGGRGVANAAEATAAAAAADAAALGRAKAAVDTSVAGYDSATAAARALHAGREATFAGWDLPGIAGGQTTRARMAEHLTAQELLDRGLADLANLGAPGGPGTPLMRVQPAAGKAAAQVLPPTPTAAGTVHNIDVLGRTATPPGIDMSFVRQAPPNANRMAGRGLLWDQTTPLPLIEPFERQALAQKALSHPGGWQALDADASAMQRILNEVLTESGNRAAGSVPVPTLGDAVGFGGFAGGGTPGGWTELLSGSPRAYDAMKMAAAQAAPDIDAALGVAGRLSAQRAAHARAARDAINLVGHEEWTAPLAAGLGAYSGGMMGSQALYGRR